MVISFSRLAMVAVLLLVSSQEKGGADQFARLPIDQSVALPMLQEILSNSQLSGSLEFWGGCDVSWPHPEFARLRSVSRSGGSVVDDLREMFADDAKMRITQESNRKVRMVQADVPRDFLEIKIHHLSFPSHFHGPKMAVYAILHTPEVLDFMDRKIGRTTVWGGWGLPGDDSVAIHKSSVPGELNDVTVAQALDYVLETFPGLWTYQNCRDPEGKRTIFVGFLNTAREVDESLLPKPKWLSSDPAN